MLAKAAAAAITLGHSGQCRHQCRLLVGMSEIIWVNFQIIFLANSAAFICYVDPKGTRHRPRKQ